MSNHTFTLGEAVCVGAILVLLSAILLPTVGAARRLARESGNRSNTIGLVKGSIIYAGTNKNYFPGRMSNGDFATQPVTSSLGVWGAAAPAQDPAGRGATVSSLGDGVIAALLNDGGVAPKSILSPVETHPRITEATANGGMSILTLNGNRHLGQSQYSYALLNFAESSLREEWQDQSRSNAILFGDRVIGAPGHVKSYSSVHTAVGSGTWSGHLAFGDAHCDYDGKIQNHHLSYAIGPGLTHTGNCPDIFDSTYGWDPAANQFRGLLRHGCPTPP